VCGIIGYTGRRDAADLIIGGLRRLEYRGYDSFGVATKSDDGGIAVFKKSGRISENKCALDDLGGHHGIGHTRWATHGIPDDRNAHPHMDCRDEIAIVHNGIIENFAHLKKDLEGRGHAFRSDTDTEVIAHLIEEHFSGDLFEAVRLAVKDLEGTYALLVIAAGDGRLIAARNSSPLVLGVGDGEMFAASDLAPLLEHTERVIFLEDGDIAALSPEGVEVCHAGKAVTRGVERVAWRLDDVHLGGFAHYMLKEIFEEPQVFFETFRAPVSNGVARAVSRADTLSVVACGSSYHAGLTFAYLAESLCGLPVRVWQASEYRYYPPPQPGSAGAGLVVAVTQSGETADTLAALKQAKAHNSPTLAITNVPGSSVTRIADSTYLMRAGPEISVAATKSFIAQLAACMRILTRLCGNSFDEVISRAHIAIGEALLTDVSDAVAICASAASLFFVGRGPFYPAALEGALKMKEITYIHAEGYAAGELKHGPFALLTPDTPVIALCMPGATHSVMLSNIKEMKARGAPVIGVGVKGDAELAEVVDVFIPVPGAEEVRQVLTATVTLQLLAYHTALALDRDIDKPRNLAKSVTVE